MGRVTREPAATHLELTGPDWGGEDNGPAYGVQDQIARWAGFWRAVSGVQR